MSIASRREFLVKEKLFTIRDKNFIIDPATEEKIGYFIAKIFSIRTTYLLKRMDDVTELIVQKKLIAMRPTFKFYRPTPDDKVEDENYLGQLKKALVSIGGKYWFEDANENRLFDLKGNIFGFKFKILKNGVEVGEINRKLFKIRDTYGIRLANDLSDQEALLMLGTVIILNYMKEQKD
ncbi:MAG: LURP-one-related/scramblase family protein [Promethearchaeota archaeon]